MKTGYMKLLTIAPEIKVESDELLIALFPDIELRFISKELVKLYKSSKFEENFSNIEDSIISPSLDEYFSLCNSDISVYTVLFDTLMDKYKATIMEISKYGEFIPIEDTIAFMPKDGFGFSQENAEMIINFRVKLESLVIRIEINKMILAKLSEIAGE